MTSTSPVALVTGASSGIGEASAEALAAAGYTVYGTSRRGAQAGQRAFKLLALDVTSDESVDAAIQELLRLEGRIDLLVNNAGFGVSPAAAEESSIEQAKAILDTNFLGVVRMTRAVVPHMRRQGSGRIINIGSIIGLVPTPYAALYAASKHAVEGYSRPWTTSCAATGSGLPSSNRPTPRPSSRRTIWPPTRRWKPIGRFARRLAKWWRRPWRVQTSPPSWPTW